MKYVKHKNFVNKPGKWMAYEFILREKKIDIKTSRERYCGYETSISSALFKFV